jgi:hypothetical protein
MWAMATNVLGKRIRDEEVTLHPMLKKLAHPGA